LTWLTFALRVAVAASLTAGVVLGSALPYTNDSGQQSLIRLSWRAVGNRAEACREPTKDELAALPAHMRRSEICEARLSPFRLVVAIDGAPVLERVIRPGGARHDRPAYVFQEFSVAPGTHRLQIAFTAEPGEGVAATQQAPLLFDQPVTLQPREIFLVSHDAETDALAAIGSPDR